MQLQKLIVDGLWNNNPALVQLLGLCPLLAVSGTVVNGLGLGLATTLTLMISNLTVSLVRNQLPDEVRIPVFVMIIAAAVTSIELIISAWFYQLYLILGIFIPLIVTNCAIIGRAEAFASKNTPAKAAVDGLAIGIGFTLVLFVLGASRELIGQGTLLSQAHLMFGEAARGWTIQIEGFKGALLAILPPGAFLGLGSIIALKNVIDHWQQKQAAKEPVVEAVPQESPG